MQIVYALLAFKYCLLEIVPNVLLTAKRVLEIRVVTVLRALLVRQDPLVGITLLTIILSIGRHL